jgi:hypothetical protein
MAVTLLVLGKGRILIPRAALGPGVHSASNRNEIYIYVYIYKEILDRKGPRMKLYTRKGK